MAPTLKSSEVNSPASPTSTSTVTARPINRLPDPTGLREAELFINLPASSNAFAMVAVGISFNAIKISFISVIQIHIKFKIKSVPKYTAAIVIL